MQNEFGSIAWAKNWESIELEMTYDHLTTKNNLLTEVLNKRNKDISTLEHQNKKLIHLTQQYETQILKMKEEIEV